MQPSSAPTPAFPGPVGLPPRRRMVRAERRGLVVAVASSAIVLILLVVVAILAPGSHEVRRAFLSAGHLRDAAFGTDKTTSVVAAFFSVTVRMFLVAEVLVLGFALLLAVVRSLPGPVFFPLRVLTIVYIDLFRGIPLLLVMFIIGFGLPGMQPPLLPRRL